jgi:hypothetical protein
MSGDEVALAVRHRPPPNRYSYPVMAEPPFEVGAVNATRRKLLPGVTVTLIGALGVSSGVADASADHEPGPAVFAAATRNTYAVAFVRPVTVAVVADDVASVNVVKDPPLLALYCTT